MLFANIKPLIFYRGQTRCPVPKGNPVGKGECLVFINPTSENTLKMLAPGCFMYYREGNYKKYYAEYYYREKIGNKKLNIKATQQDMEEFKESDFASPVMKIPRGGLHSIAVKKMNILYDVGRWHELFFKYRRKRSPRIMATEYIDFLVSKLLNKSEFEEYNKTLIIDTHQWAGLFNKKMTFNADCINNPITIILYLMYKAPEILEPLKDYTIFFMNSEDKDFFILPGTEMTKQNFGKVKRFLKNLTKSEMDVDLIEDVSEETEVALARTNIVPNDEAKKLAELKIQLKNKIAKNFLGVNTDEEAEPSEDVTVTDEEDEDTSNETPVLDVEDDELKDEIETEVDELIEGKSIKEIEEMIEKDDKQVLETARKISKKVFTNKFMPEYDKVHLNRIERLQTKQDEIIEPVPFTELNDKENPRTVKFLKSKIIDENDVSEAVRTPNRDYTNMKFVNFDKSYCEKKKEADIDHSVAMLSKASKKIFVTGKEVKDTSNQLTFKETRTYHLEDEDGKKATIKFDVPKIIDDHYIFVNGNKKLLHHQLVTKPIIKNKPNQVKINSFYNKLICERSGRNDAVVSPIMNHLLKFEKENEVKVGNSERKNAEYVATLESGSFAKRIYSFKTNNWMVITHINSMYDYIQKHNGDCKKPTKNNYPMAFNTKTKEVMYFDADHDSYGEKLMTVFNDADQASIKKRKIPSNQYFSRCEIMEKKVPIILLVLHAIGLSETLKVANIENVWIPKDEGDQYKKELKKYEEREWDSMQLDDGVLLWKREPLENSMLMSGLKGARIDFSNFTREEMDSKDTYIFSLNRIYNHSNMSYNLDQFADFMVDDVTKEILEDFGMPNTYIGLLLLANKMLCDLNYLPETDMRNMRVRSTEIISYHVYKAVTSAYNDYRKSSHRMFSKKMSIKQNTVISNILKSNLTEEESVVNPFMEIEKAHGITYRGESGIGVDRAMTLDKRAYNESMLGVLAITSSNDGNIGIARELTLEPIITSTRGYIDFKGQKNVEDLTAANLLSPGELLNPMGIEHDDPARTAMAVKQSKQMIPVDDSEPGMITNGFDKVMPYHMSKEFAIIAEEDGEVVDEKDGMKVIKYKSGKYQTIDTNPQVRKNSASGFYIITSMVCDKKVGDKVKKNEVVGCEKQAFRKNKDDLSATMTRGPFIKVAIAPRWDCYEDSNPITATASDKLASTMAMEEKTVIKASAKIEYIAKIGDKINSGDPLIKFDEYNDDPDVQAFMQLMRARLDESDSAYIESSATSIKAHHTGEIVDIKIYSSVDLDEMSPTMRQVVETYYNKLNKRINFLKKYQNEGDNNYYMSGQMINEFPEPIEPDDRGMMKGTRVDRDVIFIFYIKFKDYIKKGDKITAEFALKGIDSQVIPRGLEPYSEFRPDEEIGLIIAPHTPTARKTTGIFKSMFINKLLIEKKRQLKEYWESVKDTIK